VKIQGMSKGNFFMGVLAGAAAGALLGVLLAPDKGSETRRKVSEKGQDYVDTLTLKFNELMSELDDKLEKMKEEFEKVKSAAQEVKDDIKST